MKHNCRFCFGTNVRRLVSYADYPVFIGCSDKPPEDDELYSFTIYLCRDCGGMQQIDLPPLNVVDRERHFFGRGETWQDHYQAYYDFIEQGLGAGAGVLEIGGGTGTMLRRLINSGRKLRLYDVEPYPGYDLPEVKTFRSYFDLDFQTDQKFDAIFSSHLVEHISDIHAFFDKARKVLRENGSLFTACPNILESFRNRHLNAFTTDHLNYLSPKVLGQIAATHGFAVERYYMFRDHGMYFHFKAAGEPAAFDRNLAQAAVSEIEAAYEKYMTTLNAFAKWAAGQATEPIYLYGAHAFTITFLRHMPSGLPYQAVLDNEPTKQNRRVCGTNLQCRSPAVIGKECKPTVIIYMGAYTQEIVSQLKSINPGVRLLRLDEFLVA